MKTFRHYSAKARCRRFPLESVGVISYSGIVGTAALEALGALALDALADMRALVIRFDKCVLVAPGFGEAIGLDLQRGRDACVVVRKDQYEEYAAYARRMAENGIKRIVFLDSQQELAQEWIGRRAAAPFRLVREVSGS